MKTQLIYMIITICSSTASDDSDSNLTSADIEDSQMVLAGNKDVLRRNLLILESLIIRIENTYIITDGPYKKFQPSRKHEHNFEYELFNTWLKFLNNIRENLKDLKTNMHEAISITFKDRCLINDNACVRCELYLKNWIEGSSKYLGMLLEKCLFLHENELKERFFPLFCLHIDTELDSYINNALEFEYNTYKELDVEKNLLHTSISNYLVEYKKLNDTIDITKNNFLETKSVENINKVKDEINKMKHNFFIKQIDDASINELDSLRKRREREEMIEWARSREEKRMESKRGGEKIARCGTPAERKWRR